jgi:hypothetical protein
VYGRTETTYKKQNDKEKGQCEQYEMKEKQMKDANEMENRERRTEVTWISVCA